MLSFIFLKPFHRKYLWKSNLKGSLKLSQLETQLTFAQNVSSSEAFPAFRNICGAFRRLFLNTARFYGADHVLVDMAPSIGELNKNLLFSSDFFFIPMTADAYCRSTVYTLKEILPAWRAKQKLLAAVTKTHV